MVKHSYLLVQENDSVSQQPERHSLLILPQPSVVAGDRFREIYYWDSYFIVEGLLVSGMTQTAMVGCSPCAPPYLTWALSGLSTCSALVYTAQHSVSTIFWLTPLHSTYLDCKRVASKWKRIWKAPGEAVKERRHVSLLQAGEGSCRSRDKAFPVQSPRLDVAYRMLWRTWHFSWISTALSQMAPEPTTSIAGALLCNRREDLSPPVRWVVQASTLSCLQRHASSKDIFWPFQSASSSGGLKGHSCLLIWNRKSRQFSAYTSLCCMACSLTYWGCVQSASTSERDGPGNLHSNKWHKFLRNCLWLACEGARILDKLSKTSDGQCRGGRLQPVQILVRFVFSQTRVLQVQ